MNSVWFLFFGVFLGGGGGFGVFFCFCFFFGFLFCFVVLCFVVVVVCLFVCLVFCFLFFVFFFGGGGGGVLVELFRTLHFSVSLCDHDLHTRSHGQEKAEASALVFSQTSRLRKRKFDK